MNSTVIRRIALATGLALAPAATSFGANEVNTTSGYTAAGAPLALHGFDPVSYFSASTPTAGDARFTAVHDGAAYYFARQENLDLFKANPAKYAPAYGGFCAFGVSVGKKFDGDPRYWKIVDGKLYLNLNEEIAQKFNADPAGSIAKAEKNWPSIYSTAVGDL
jgi:YHS domain-containing protein